MKITVFSTALHVVELMAQGLAAGTVLLAIVLFYFREKSDGCKDTAHVIGNYHHIENNSEESHACEQEQIFGRAIQKDCLWEEIETLTELGDMAYKLNNITKSNRRIRFKAWHEAEPRSIMIFENEKKEMVGYLITLPMDNVNATGRSHYNGEVFEFDIDKKFITNKNTTLILSQGICIDARFAKNPKAVQIFLDCYCRHIAGFMPLDEKQIQETVIYAEPVSSYNNKLLKELGFLKSQTKSKAGRNLYELRFNEKEFESEYGYKAKWAIRKFIEERKAAGTLKSA